MTETSAPSPRRSSAEHAPSRDALLDAARHLIINDGYASVTARRVATEAGLKPQLVHYYFASMDELFVQLVRRDAAGAHEQLDRALTSAQPLRALWDLSTDTKATALSMEYLAVANHRKAIAAEVATAAEQFRLLQYDAFREALARYDIVTPISTQALLLTLEGLARIIVMERGVGAATFHDQALDMIEQMLTEFEGPKLE